MGRSNAPTLWLRAPESDDRGAADEAAADVARARYRCGEMPALVPDEAIAPRLLPGEWVLAVHGTAVLDRREPTAGAQLAAGLAGTLYVTSRRLVMVGRPTLAFRLDAIDEAALSGERLLLMLRDGRCITVDVARPRLLRVEIAAARAAARASTAAPKDATPSDPKVAQPASR